MDVGLSSATSSRVRASKLFMGSAFSVSLAKPFDVSFPRRDVGTIAEVRNRIPSRQTELSVAL